MPGIKYPIPHVPMLGKGSILFDIFDPVSGLSTGLQHLGNCTKFEIDMKDDIKELYQSLNKNVTLIATAVAKRQPKVAITGTDFSSNHIAIAAMSAGKTTLATAVSTFTAEVLISATVANPKGRYFRTLNPNIDNVTTPPVVQQGTTTFVAGTDYIVADPVTGLIYIPLTSGIAALTATTITYHTLLGSFDQVAGATVPHQQGHLVFVPDPVDGQKIGVDIWRCNLNPNGQIGLIADDYGNWTLDGQILDDTANHPLAPFYQYTFY